MKSLRLQKENIIKDVRNLFRLKKEMDVRIIFRLKKETDDNTVNDIRNIFRLKKENEAIKDRIIRKIRNLFEYEKESYDKPGRVCNFQTNNYIEYGSNSDRHKTL